MAGNPHVRQHYIPQFILRNFCCDDKRENVNFYNAVTKEVSTQYVSNVFMERYLYSEEKMSLTTEEYLAKFETEEAPQFKPLCNNTEILLTFDEYERLKLFLSLLAFRSKNIKEQFKNMSAASKASYGVRNEDELCSLWLNNVKLISQCRSIKEVCASSDINPILKLFWLHEFMGFYMCLLERRGSVDFVISDCYPTVMNGEVELPDGRQFNIPLYYFFPISSDRMLVLVSNHISEVPTIVSTLDVKKTLKQPRETIDGKHLMFRAVKIYEAEVEWINEMIIKNANSGVVIKDLNRGSVHFN